MWIYGGTSKSKEKLFNDERVKAHFKKILKFLINNLCSRL